MVALEPNSGVSFWAGDFEREDMIFWQIKPLYFEWVLSALGDQRRTKFERLLPVSVYGMPRQHAPAVIKLCLQTEDAKLLGKSFT